eukprot:TRINITY_DN7184_c0_g1_i2.p1 TRINITY_DN7184_c0_g1~~TRINITY_DN7184_c0_g1_i2.p1  ORF type:complete len:157 (+),score=45.39 TRINITY_DN7184_c0_g1_i2:66-473(+)
MLTRSFLLPFFDRNRTQLMIFYFFSEKNSAETGDFDPFLLTDPAKITQFPVEALENAISRRRSQKSQKTEKDNENVVRCVFSYLAAKRESEQINGQKAEIEAEMSAILADFEAFARQNGREKNDTNNGGETARKS